jgi:D-lyxose ketol-isomerase
MTPEQIKKEQKKAAEMLDNAKIALTEEERSKIEICDYNLNNYNVVGTAIVIYVNTKRCCAKEMVMYPYQLCPEHLHPPVGDYQGKEETFRCRWGEVYLYVPGEKTDNIKAKIPAGKENTFHAWHEIILKPGEQYTLKEKTLHWFEGGPEGAIISEFSTPSFDDQDIFSDPQILRTTNLDKNIK